MAEMLMKLCLRCGKEVWHNPLRRKANESQEYRCTYCGSPAGTGPKAERNTPITARQLQKVGR